MCGIGGFFLKSHTIYSSEKVLLFLNSIRRRGPDDEGICLIDTRDNVFRSFCTDRTVPSFRQNLPHLEDKSSAFPHDLLFIHARYAIIDLSDAAHQPFVSNDKSVVCLFNGEIYNYIELRDELLSKNVSFRTSSDTEVLVEGYRYWGHELWGKMNGFWAVALYDFKNNTFVLSRDRIGVAPLYYREMADGFFFSSTIQPLIDVEPETIHLDHDVILGFAQTGIKDHESTTFYQEIKSIPSSSTLLFYPGQFMLSGADRIQYWDFPKARMTTSDISFDEAKQRYREAFFQAVELRLRADVKVAFELSGGLDSSSVVAAAAHLRNNDITTYTAKIKDADEEPYARAILDLYPVDYHVVENLEGGFDRDYGSFSRIMEEPYDNPNDYTHNRMLREMKDQGVSVVVTGAGGDEILAGYEAGFWPKAYHELKNNGFYLAADWYEFCRRFKTFKQSWKTLQHYIVDLPRFIKEKLSNEATPLKRTRMTRALKYQNAYGGLSFHEQSLYHFKVALVPYYMRSSDHFTMDIPIEHRFPLLDYRIVELCLQMPIYYLFRNGWTKYLLRKAMEPYLPRNILWRRKKMGFTFPYRQYFSAHQSTFKRLLHHLQDINFPAEDFDTYDELLRTNPVLLWRLLSIAIWVESNVKAH